MSNTCDDAFQEVQALQQRQQELRRQLDESERARKAGEVFTRSEVGNQVIVPDRFNNPRVLDDKELSRGLQQIAGGLESRTMDQYIENAMGLGTRPHGAEGQFINFRQLLQQFGDVREAADWAKFARAFHLTWETISPEDYAFMTEVYGREKLAELFAKAFPEENLTVPGLMAAMANDAAAFHQMPERMARSTLVANETLALFRTEVDKIAAYMESLPGAAVPDALKQQAYSTYKTALLAQRHWAFNKRRTGQTLRMLQEGTFDTELPDFVDTPWLTPEADRLTPGAQPTRPPGEAEEIIGLTPDDVGPDSMIGKIIEAVDDGPGGLPAIRDIIDTIDIEGFDPKARLDQGWFNTTMRLGIAHSKDSKLSSIATQMKAEVSNVNMMFYGPLKIMLKNGMVMVPAGTGSLKRLGLIESAKIHAQAYRYGWHMTRVGMKKMLKEAYFEGMTRFGGNPDVYGRRMSVNKEVEAQQQAILKQQWATKNWAANVAMLGPKANAYTRQTLKKLWHDMPLQPWLRMLGATDEVHGKFQYLFHLKADLEVKARAEAVTLGLDTEAKRNDWVQQQIELAVYQATPTEANIKAFRKQMKAQGVNLGPMDGQMGLDGIDVAGTRMTDQQVMDLMVKQNMAGSPTFGTPASLRAFQYAAETRFQETPRIELGRFMGAKGDWISEVDKTVIGLRSEKSPTGWMFDTALPFWRTPVNALLFDLRLATSPFYDPIKMLAMTVKATEFTKGGNPLADLRRGFKKASGEEAFQEVAARFAISLGLLTLWGAADDAGLIIGNSHPDPAKRNSFMGMPYLGGLPILSTLFLWKDVKDAHTKGGASDLDGNEAFTGIAQVLTGYLMRGTGIAQLQTLVSALSDGNVDAFDALAKFGGFMVKGGYVPFVGAVNSVERSLGLDLANQYQDGKNTPLLDFERGQAADADDPLAPVLEKLRAFAYSAVPGLAGIQGHRRDKDWVGYDRGHIAGIDFAKVFPGFPGAWPNDPIYAELETMGQLDPPVQFRRRNLDGVGMSAALQREAIDIYGSVKGDSLLGINAMVGRQVTAKFPIEFSTVLPNGARVKGGEVATIDLGAFLEKHVKGKKVADALRSLLNDPLYQAMEADPKLTSDLSRRDMPQALRRQQPAQLMIAAIKAYYLDETRNELERRAAAGTSAEAKAWSDAKTQAVIGRTKDALERLQATINALGGGR